MGFLLQPLLCAVIAAGFGYGVHAVGPPIERARSTPAAAETVHRPSRGMDGVQEQVLHSFGASSDGESPTGVLINAGGTFYGTTEYGGSGFTGTVYSVTAGGAEQVVYSFAGFGSDGAGTPLAGLILENGLLYGTTTFGGANGDGDVYSVTTGGAESVLHSFGKGKDGAKPESALIDVGGVLYGTTFEGGTGKCNHNRSR